MGKRVDVREGGTGGRKGGGKEEETCDRTDSKRTLRDQASRTIIVVEVGRGSRSGGVWPV